MKNRAIQCCASLFVLLLVSCGSQPRKPALQVDITSYLGEDQIFSQHDQLSFLISLNNASWLYLFYENADGRLFQLIPSVLYPNHFVDAGDFIEFPESNAGFQIEIAAPYGKERVWLLASEKEIELPQGFNQQLEELTHSLSGLKQQLAKQLKSQNVRFAEDELRFTTSQSI